MSLSCQIFDRGATYYLVANYIFIFYSVVKAPISFTHLPCFVAPISTITEIASIASRKKVDPLDVNSISAGRRPRTYEYNSALVHIFPISIATRPLWSIRSNNTNSLVRNVRVSERFEAEKKLYPAYYVLTTRTYNVYV